MYFWIFRDLGICVTFGFLSFLSDFWEISDFRKFLILWRFWQISFSFLFAFYHVFSNLANRRVFENLVFFEIFRFFYLVEIFGLCKFSGSSILLFFREFADFQIFRFLLFFVFCVVFTFCIFFEFSFFGVSLGLLGFSKIQFYGFLICDFVAFILLPITRPR